MTSAADKMSTEEEKIQCVRCPAKLANSRSYHNHIIGQHSGDFGLIPYPTAEIAEIDKEVIRIHDAGFLQEKVEEWELGMEGAEWFYTTEYASLINVEKERLEATLHLNTRQTLIVDEQVNSTIRPKFLPDDCVSFEVTFRNQGGSNTDGCDALHAVPAADKRDHIDHRNMTFKGRNYVAGTHTMNIGDGTVSQHCRTVGNIHNFSFVLTVFKYENSAPKRQVIGFLLDQPSIIYRALLICDKEAQVFGIQDTGKSIGQHYTAFLSSFDELIASTGIRVSDRVRNLPLSWAKGKGSFDCAICRDTFSDDRRLKVHETWHKTKKCPGCQTVFSKLSKEEFMKHVYNHTKIYCSKCCGKWFWCKQVMQQHVRNVHGMKQFECKECGKKFPTSVKLGRHAAIHNKTVNPRFKCDECDATFKSTDGLKAHVKKNHRRGSVTSPKSVSVTIKRPIIPRIAPSKNLFPNSKK